MESQCHFSLKEVCVKVVGECVCALVCACSVGMGVEGENLSSVFCHFFMRMVFPLTL